MIFKRIADAVIKHSKKVLAIWVVIFILMGYLAFLSSDVVVYEDTEMAPPDVESAKADEIVSDEFLDLPNATAIIVLQKDDITSPEMTRYVLELEERIRNESSSKCDSEQRIQCFENITTIYSIYRSIINAMASSLGPTMYDLEANVTGFAFMMYGIPYIYISIWDGMSYGVNGSAFMVYGIPTSYLQAVEGVDQTAFLLYGLPSMFAQAWDGVNGSTMMMHGIPSMFAQAWDGINGSALMMYGIPSMFAQAWDGVNGSALMMYGIPSMFAEAWYGVNTTSLMLYGVPYMYEETFVQVNQTAELIYGGPASYMDNWSSLSMISDMTQRNQEAFNQSWDVLNASVTSETERQLLYGYQIEFHRLWNETFDILSAEYLPPTTLPADRAQAVVNGTAPVYFDFTDPVNETQQFQAGVWSSLNITNFTEPAALNDHTNGTAWQVLLCQTAALDIPTEQMAMLEGYFDTFAFQWNLSFYDLTTENLTAEDRASHVIGLIAQPYIEQVSGTDQSKFQMMMGVLQGFDMTTWDDVSVQNAFTDDMFRAQMANMMSGFDLSLEMEQQLWAYLDTFYLGWNGSFQNGSLTNTTPGERAEAVVHQVGPDFIDDVTSMEGADPMAGAMLEAVLTGFNITNWDEPTLVNRVTNQTFHGSMQAMIGEFGLDPGLEQQALEFYSGFYGSWEASFDDASAVFDHSLERAEASVLSFAPGYIENASAGNQSMKAMLDGVLGTFNISTWNDTDLLNSYSRFLFINTLDSMGEEMGLPGSQVQEMLTYFDLFMTEWEATFDDNDIAGLSSHERAEVAVDGAGPTYVAQVSVGDPLKETFLTGILHDFNGSTWDNISMKNRYAYSRFIASIGPMASDMGLPASEVEGLERYMELLYVQWNASFKLPPLVNYTSIDRAEYAALAAAPSFIEEVAAGDQATEEMMLGVLDGSDMDTWNDTSAINSLSYSIMDRYLTTMGADLGLDNESLGTAREYLEVFHGSWDSSYSEPGLENATSSERAVWAISEAVPIHTADRPFEEAMFTQAVHEGLDMSNWNDTRAQDLLVNSMAYARTRSVIEDVLVNMTGDMTMNETMTVMIWDYLDIFHDQWNLTFDPGSANHLPRATEPLVRGKAVVDSTAPAYFRFETVDDDASKFMYAMWSTFGLANWSDLSAAHEFTIDHMAASMAENARDSMSFERSFYEDIYDLGPDPTPEVVEAFTEDILWHGTLDTYPVQLSDTIVSQFVNDKNDTMLVVMGFSKAGADKIKGGLEETGDISRAIKKERGISALTIHVSGPAPLSIQLEETVDSDIHRIDIVTAVIVFILISMFFRSFVTPGMPLLSIGAAIVATFGMIFIIGSYLLQIHYTVVTLTVTAMMGAGVDYCIFIIARYKEEREKGKDVEDSVRTSIIWAGESITTSGVAVMIGFGGLSVLTFAMVQGMGYILPIGIGIAILVALTFLPALMVHMGDRMFWRPKFLRRNKKRRMKERKKGSKRKVKRRAKASRGSGTKDRADDGRVFYFSNAVELATTHAKTIVVLALIISIPSSYLVLTLETSYDFFSGIPDSEAKLGIDAMADGFGKSKGMETKVVVEMDGPIYEDGGYDTDVLDSIDDLTERIRAHDSVKRADPSTYSEGERIDHVDCWSVFGDEWKDSCLQRALGRSNRTVVITVVLKDEPFSKVSIDSIDDIRALVKRTQRDDLVLRDAKILVGGATAGMHDIEALIESNTDIMRIVVIVGIFILLLIVLGSVLIPVTAIISIGLSISWTLALTMLVFPIIMGQPILWLMPMILFVVLMGLGMDYNIFIITRMREEVLKGYSDEVAIRRAVERTGGIITACGAIMAGAFGSMMLSAMGLLQQFGFALFFAIILDAFVIRIYLMPAIIVLLKKWNWWAPGRLQRISRDEKGRVIVRGQGPKGPGRSRSKAERRGRSRRRVREEE